MRTRTGPMFVLILWTFPLQVNATIYGWQEDGGALNLSNHAEAITDTQAAQKYTPRFAKQQHEKSAQTHVETENKTEKRSAALGIN